MAIPALKLNFPGDPPTFCCPVCGCKIFTENCDDKWCEHVVFAGETFSGEWVWNHQTYEAVFDEAVAKHFEGLENKDEYEDIKEYLSDEGIELVSEVAQNAIDSDSAFLYVVSTYGMACGPVGGAVYAIVDYEPETEE